MPDKVGEQARNQGGAEGGRRKNVLDIVTIGHSLKNLGPSQKPLHCPLCPKLVTGLYWEPMVHCFMPRAGLKPMQPMRLHWAPRLRGPRAMVVGQVVYFCQILLAHGNCRKAYKSHS